MGTLFYVVYFSRRTLPQKRGKGHYWDLGTFTGDRLATELVLCCQAGPYFPGFSQTSAR